MEKMTQEELNKSIDGILDEIYEDEVVIQKSDTKSNVVSISEDEWNEYRSLKKSKLETSMDNLRKSFLEDDQKDILKSAITEATEDLKRENRELKKAFRRQRRMIKDYSEQPKPSKMITAVDNLGKSIVSDQPRQTNFTKSEKLDVAEALFKSGKLRDNHVIELENNGYIYDKKASKILNDELNRR